MYSRLIRRAWRTETPIDDVEERLHNLGYIDWVGITPQLEDQFRKSPTPEAFVRMLMYLNRFYVGRRYSNRYHRFVNFGNAGQRPNSNRSIVDMFLIAKQYCPQYANLRLLYDALMTWYCNDLYIRAMICSTINRRVWYYRSNDTSLNGFLTSKGDCSTKLRVGYENQEMLKHDEFGTKIRIDLTCDPPYRIEYVESKDLVIPDGKLGVIGSEEPSPLIFIKA